ncbi:MAG TPA: class I SAM-dependent methyltransferase [Pyrinomonadaceae bacterium]|nr:class I SAM-dependent methyltransferase [Pyrinomonadaceae bacterium]
MSENFGRTYAGVYDLLYAEKDYEGECDAVERLFRTHADGRVREVLDLGCGTGGHALPLARRGYSVVGLDRSEEMRARAEEKLKTSDITGGGHAEFMLGDVRGADLGRRFDACLMMFAVLGYQTGNEDVLAALKAARRHLREGGLFVFDVWYGPAVLAERPSERVKILETERGHVIRVAAGELDARRHACTVRYQVWRVEEGRPIEHTAEEHSVRFFFPLELEHLLSCAGFEMLRLGSFPDFERDPGEQTWNVMCAARAV